MKEEKRTVLLFSRKAPIKGEISWSPHNFCLEQRKVSPHSPVFCPPASPRTVESSRNFLERKRGSLKDSCPFSTGFYACPVLDVTYHDALVCMTEAQEKWNNFPTDTLFLFFLQFLLLLKQFLLYHDRKMTLASYTRTQRSM